MYAATLESFVGRHPIAPQIAKAPPRPAPTEENDFFRPVPQSKTRPQSKEEALLWTAGVDTTGMRHAAMRGMAAAMIDVAGATCGEQFAIVPPDMSNSSSGIDFANGYTLGIRVFMVTRSVCGGND